MCGVEEKWRREQGEKENQEEERRTDFLALGKGGKWKREEGEDEEKEEEEEEEKG